MVPTYKLYKESLLYYISQQNFFSLRSIKNRYNQDVISSSKFRWWARIQAPSLQNITFDVLCFNGGILQIIDYDSFIQTYHNIAPSIDMWNDILK